MFKQKFAIICENYFYKPNFIMQILSIILLPFSLLYIGLIYIKFYLTFNKKNFDIPIISVGNLVLGGSGKSPLCKAIYALFEDKLKVFIVLRGYKRKTKKLKVVSNNNKIFTSTKECGDEAMDYALNNINVIVSINRKEGILKAKQLGAGLVILDDGFSKFDIQKFNILLRPFKKPKFPFCIPSGVYRYPKSFYKLANFIPSKDDIKTQNEIINKTANMLLVTSIANPTRLKKFYDICVGYYHFSDHYDFKKNELEILLKKHNATSLLLTSKDYAKIKNFNLPCSIIKLNVELSQNFKEILLNYALKG